MVLIVMIWIIASLVVNFPFLHRNEIKREGSGRGNWGTPADEIVP